MKRLLPILFWSVLAAAFIGPGTVTTAASAGAGHGHALLWALAFSTLATLVLQEAAARLTVVSGRNLAESIRDRFRGGALGSLVLLLVLGAIVVGNAAYQAGNILGAVAGAELGTRLPREALTLLVGAGAAAVLALGTPRRVAQLLGATVAVMGVAFLVTALLLRPEPRAVAAGLVPALPPGSGLLVLGLVGTTVVPYNLFLGSGIAGGQSLRDIRLGISVAVLLGGLISMGILVVGTTVQGEFGFPALSAALQGRLGAGAGSLFAWGLFAAGLSSAITAPLAAAVTARALFHDGSSRWDVFGWRYRAVWGGVLLVGVGFGLAGVRPVPAIILAQALNGILLPFAAVFLLLMVNDRVLMGERGLNGALSNAAMAIVVLVTLLLGVSNLLRAGGNMLGFGTPSEALLLGTAAGVALALSLPVATAVLRRRAAAALVLTITILGACAPALPGVGTLATTTEPLMQPGVSLALARERAATLSRVEYDLSLDLTGTDRVPGEVVIRLHRAPGAGDLVLDFRGEKLERLEVNGRAVQRPDWRHGHIAVPAAMLREGANELRLAFVARMAPAGASVIRFAEPLRADGAPGDTYLYTLLVPADANLLFPSLD